jgi:two-component system sensor histidine kinase PilS (NtrC family)
MRQNVAQIVDNAFAAYLRQSFLKFTSSRIGIIFVFLIIVIFELLNFVNREIIFIPFRQQLYIIFFCIGFGANIFYIFLYKYLLYNKFFFISQIYLDIILILIWLIITGVTFSPFIFLIFIMIFYYGKYHGIKFSIFISIIFAISLFIISCFQFYYPYFWGEIHINGSYIAYNFFMICVGFILVNGLVRIQQSRDIEIIHHLEEKEKALKKSEELQSKVFHGMDASLMVLDNDGRITLLNESAQKEIGKDQEITGKNINHVFPEFTPFWNARWNIPNRNIIQSPYRNKVYGFRLTQLGQEGWILLFSDITEIQRLERQVQEMERFVAVADLAAGLAHEMKNPLAGIKASLQLILSGGLEENQRQRLANVVIRDVDRLDSLVRDFLVFARPSQPCRETVSISSAIDEVVKNLTIRYPRIQWNIKIPNVTWMVDRKHFYQILMNIICNACQAIEASRDGMITLSYEENSTISRIKIHDNGPGMTAEMLSRCFDPFITTKPHGTGLGLAISKRLAMANNIVLTVEQNPESGVTFILSQSNP